MLLLQIVRCLKLIEDQACFQSISCFVDCHLQFFLRLLNFIIELFKNLHYEVIVEF